MNVRYFSWENEFGDEDERPFAAVPTALVGGDNLRSVLPTTRRTDDALWLPEGMEAESVEPQGKTVIGTEESWIELKWNIEHRSAWLTLYTAEGDIAIECWRHTITIPEMRYEEDVDVVRHLTCLAELCYSLYAASPDAMNLIPQMADALIDFGHFLERLVD